MEALEMNTLELFNSILKGLTINTHNDEMVITFAFGYNKTTGEYISSYDTDPVSKVFKNPNLIDYTYLNHLCHEYEIRMTITEKDDCVYYIFDTLNNVNHLTISR